MNQQYGQGGGSGGQHYGLSQGGGYGSQQGGSAYGGQGGQSGGYGQGMGQGMGPSSGGYGNQGGYGGMQGGGYGGQGGQGGYGGQRQNSEVAFNPYTMDKDYDLISVLYHALQAVDTCAKYRQDAQSQGSPEIAAFMEQVQQQNLQISLRAKELLFRQRQV